MDKDKSLAFLQNCIDMVNSATDDDISMFQGLYTTNCTNILTSSEFEFLLPSYCPKTMFEFDDEIEITFSKTDINKNEKKIQLQYNFFGMYAYNAQDNDDAAFAA